MKTQLDIVFTSDRYFQSAAPQWVSELGLEWLHELLLTFGSAKKPLRQN